MRTRLFFMVLVSTLMIVEAYPHVCEAKGKKGSVKKKKAKKAKKVKQPKTDSSVQDNPYADGKDAAADATAAPGEEEQEVEAKSAAEATAEAVEGTGDQAAEDKGGFLQPGGGGESGSVRRSNRMEFDERLVKGQAAKSGAVYLFQRVPRRLPGLVPMRRSYRKRIVEPVLGKRELKPAVYSEKPSDEPAAEAAAEGESTEKAPDSEASKPETEKAEDKAEKK
ncbi:MAG: hypothetical protein JRF63_11710 [Deltaproteobacteria bacterium]|nr:hypothetical protein [Deltaproteobacteria bacterium]